MKNVSNLSNKFSNLLKISALYSTFILTITESTLGFILDFKKHDSTTERYLLKLNKDGTFYLPYQLYYSKNQ